MSIPDIAQVYATLDTSLYKAQKRYETLTEEYVNAREQYTDAVLAYEQDYAQAIKSLREQKEQVTVMKELAKEQCFDKYRTMLLAENLKKRVTALRESALERINTIKALSRMKTGDMG